MKYLFIIASLIISMDAMAQPVNNLIQKGNDAYRKAAYAEAIGSYKNALRKDPANNIARFNLANALQKQKEIEEANKNYDDIIEKDGIGSLKAASSYNKGLAYLTEKDLLKAISSFKASLKEDPGDDEARENLQKAMNEVKKQQSQPENKKQPQKQNSKQKKQPPVNKEMMQQKFNELRNQEKQLQKKLQNKTGTNQPEKDW